MTRRPRERQFPPCGIWISKVKRHAGFPSPTAKNAKSVCREQSPRKDRLNKFFCVSKARQRCDTSRILLRYSPPYPGETIFSELLVCNRKNQPVIFTFVRWCVQTFSGQGGKTHPGMMNWVQRRREPPRCTDRPGQRGGSRRARIRQISEGLEIHRAICSLFSQQVLFHPLRHGPR